METLPNKVFPTPRGVIVASHGPNVDDYDKRLVVLANKFHAKQISTQANKSPGVSYLLTAFSKKEWSEQAIQILAQLSIPEASTQDIETAHQYVKGLTMTSLDEGFTLESSTSFLSSLARDGITRNFMNANVPTRSFKRKGKGKDKSKGEPRGLELHIPIEFPTGPGLQPEIPLYTTQRYWEDLRNKKLMPPDFTGHNKFRYTYNIDPIRFLRNGQIRDPPSGGQNPTLPGVLDVPSILKNRKHCRPPRDSNVPEYFNPFYQYSHLELVKLNMKLVYTTDRFERWFVEPMVNMRYSSIPFNTEGNLCHYYKQPTMWLNPCHFANKGCKEGNNCRFAHCKQEVKVAERLLRNWGHEFPHEAGALIKVYREALRVVSSINPNPQMLNTPIRCRADQKWLNVNQFHPLTQRSVLAVNNGSLPKSIPAVPPMSLQVMPANQTFPEGVQPPQPYQNDVMQFPGE